MKKLLTLFLFLHLLQSFAQGEANVWYFGKNAGVDFNNGSATPITGSLSTNEGCSSFSDKNGNLLFYSDGIKVWNRNNQVMANGSNLMGDPSSTQSAIIVPHPGYNNLFYIFTVGANDYDNYGNLINPTEGLNCYTLDINLNGGLGDITGSATDLSIGKNDDWTEKVTSVKGKDCNTFWVISLVNNTFISYKIDNSGLINSPITSPVDYDSEDPRGYLKVSPDGEKLVSATYGAGKVHLYSFDDSTGKVSNDGISLIYNPDIDGYTYGVEFSPNSTKLYCSTFNGDNSNKINKLFQFDLQNPNIVSSKYLVKPQPGYRGALQLAPNGKIYATVPVSYEIGTHSLDVINSPEELGIDCNYVPDAVNLGVNYAMQGLPPFIASLLLPVKITDGSTDQNLNNTIAKRCIGENYQLTALNIEGTPTYKWTFNNTTVSTSDTLNLLSLSNTDQGIYYFEAETVDDCGFTITYKGNVEIEVYNPPSTFNTIIYDQCDIDDDTTDGETLFNLETKISEITNDDPNLEVLFYESQSNFDNEISISIPSKYKSSDNPQLLVKITNTQSECYTIGFMELDVNPTSLDSYDDFFTCENDLASSNDPKSLGAGIGTFDFENKRQEVLNLFNNDPTVEVEFYQNTTDAQLQINQLADILEFPDKEIIVRISNNLSKNCISVGKFNLIVNPISIPNGDLEEKILCVSNPKDNPQLFTVYLNGGSAVVGDTYQWYFNNSIIVGANNIDFDADSEGIYKVEVTRNYENLIPNLNDDNYCVGFNTFKVVESNPAIINQNVLSITDDSTNNSIKINLSNQNLGLGDYEFMLVDFEGEIEYPYLVKPHFEPVEAGIHTIFIKDKKGCGPPTLIDVSVIGFPKFFTPNNDGYNDTWKVLGVNENFYASSAIYIFDRFGKLITQIDPKGEGWNGLFNGQHLPATDYWFSVELIDKNGKSRIRKGHFSLIR